MFNIILKKISWLTSVIAYRFIGVYLPHTFWPGGMIFSWIRKKMLIGMGCRIGNYCELEPLIDVGFRPDIKIGNHCQINKGVQIRSAVIGNFVMIAPGCIILDRSHNISDVSKPMILQGSSKKTPPIINDDVWLGQNVILMPGVVVGKGAVVGAGAVVTSDVKPYTIVAGVPAKLIRNRLPDEF